VNTLIVEPEGFPQQALDRLAASGTVFLGPEAADASTQAAFTRLGVLDAAFHRRFPALRWIVSPTTGLNHIDMDYFAQAGVKVLSLRGRTDFLRTIHATAEHTLALTLALIRKLPAATGAVSQGAWDRYPHKGRELFGKTVLILGYGRIGTLVAPIYRAFGCRVFAVDRSDDRVPAEFRCDLLAALAEADVLTIHLPLEPATAGFVDRTMLERLPARAIVINTARGEVLDQDALLSLIEEGRLAGAALDVLTHEPSPFSGGLSDRLSALGDRVLITPHIGGFTYESLEAVENYMTQVFLDEVVAER